MIEGKYYIYYHIDPRDNMPKYIGKGSGQRAYKMYKSTRSKKHYGWIISLRKQGLEPIVYIGNRFNCEKECYEVEKREVAIFEKLGIKLKNLAEGGLGGASRVNIKPIICLNNNITYSSSKECSEALNIDTRRVNDILKARKKSYRGYSFRYLDSNLNIVPDKIRAKAKIWKKHTNGIKIKRLDNGLVYESARQLCAEIGVSGGWITKLFKESDIITLKNIKYRRIRDGY